MSLADARLYLVSPATLRAGPLADLVPDLVAAGVDVIQLREKELEAADVLEAAAPVLAACRAAGVPFIVNDRPDVAAALDADGVHLGTRDLPYEVARRFVPDKIIGLSTHRPSEVDAAVARHPHYFAVGPVNPTPTKPGRPGTGLELVEYAAGLDTEIPWFVTGGMNPQTIPAVLDAGGRRVVVVRAITEAADPVRVAADIRSVLNGAAL